MKLIDEKYQKLKPTFEYLTNEVVIAQAWKKTHSYMRTHNWYADTLALDISALGLEQNLEIWANNILTTPHPLELVPAAKSDEWVIDKDLGWVPKASLKQKCDHKGKCDKETARECKNFPLDDYCDKDIELAQNRAKKPPIRPLANLMIKDQTLASAAMLCLADVVEDAQGDCNERDFFKAQRKHVYSYGNRLLCDWEKGPAWFRWGNSQIYRKFFTDYQNFLKRPVTIGRDVANAQGTSDLVYVVNLDLEKFYDNIDREKLIQRLKILATEKSESDEAFWEAFKQITSWQWNQEAINRAEELDINLGEGLPQGLVASGFFANAYMLDFDKKVGSCIGKEIPGDENIILHDYCRYVDDLRLVLSITNDDHYGNIQKNILAWISLVFKELGEEKLQLNEKKVSITALSDLDNAGSLAQRVKQLQHELSGPADRDVLDGTMSILEGMLTMPAPELDLDDQNKDLALAKLAKFDHDIRTDTLKRFAANRLENIMRNKRRMTEQLSDEPGSKTSPIDNESELLAKKLIWAWMKDPSLALVLRKAIEIYPSPTVLEPVLEAIYDRCSFNQVDDKKNRDLISEAIVDYVLADIFRCCIDFHGFFQRVQYPRSANPDGVISLAGQYAQKALMTGNRLPLFIKKQALLLLAVLQKPTILPEDTLGPKELVQTSLHKILAGKNPPWQHQRFALYEVAAQITNAPDMIVHLLMDEFKKQKLKEKDILVVELAKRGGPFWVHFWEKLKKIDKELAKSYQWAAPILAAKQKRTNQRLLAVAASPDNPFTDEIALLKLAAALASCIKVLPKSNLPFPGQIEIEQNENKYFDWKEIRKPGGQELSFIFTRKYPADPRYEIPEWITNNDDASKIYWIGSILRSVAIGSSDFTGNRWKAPKTHGYKGLRTGWYKRRMGMMHSPEALVGEYATCSQWITELLMTCLQWPGFESSYILHEEIKNIETLGDFENAVKMRLKQMEQLYCKATDIPAIVTRVTRPTVKDKQSFRLVTVQPIMPMTGQITPSDPALNNEKVKIINRDHLARVCQLTYKTLLAKAKTENTDPSEKSPTSDLIVFPEFAVHPDDQDIIKRLADKTKSMIFAGLCLLERDGTYSNVARWFLPDFRTTGRQWTTRDQGKGNPTDNEKKLGVVGFRPCQHIIEVDYGDEGPYRLSGAICYDSTDLALASDLKGKTDLFIIVAHNRDVRTFDTMASALHYHMYQHVAVVNKGEFGGTTIQAPFKEHYDRIISHVHGNDQISINIADLDLAAFKRESRKYKEVKKKPANFRLIEGYK